MRKLLWLFALGLMTNVFATLSVGQQRTATNTVQCGKAGEYWVNRATSNGWCKVQEATEAQMYGPTLAGGFKSRKEAISEMCRRYDFGSPDSDKCSDVLPKGTCDSQHSKDKSH